MEKKYVITDVELLDAAHNLKGSRASGTRKIAELPNAYGCRHPEHNPPSHMVFEPGVYEHVCPGCGRRHVFFVDRPTLRIHRDPKPTYERN